jgi:hypothetical protein
MVVYAQDMLTVLEFTFSPFMGSLYFLDNRSSFMPTLIKQAMPRLP